MPCLCAPGVAAAGRAYCWGSDGSGTLGDGQRYPNGNPAPQRVAGDRAGASARSFAAAAGEAMGMSSFKLIRTAVVFVE